MRASCSEAAARLRRAWASRSTAELDLAAMMAFKDEGVDGNVKGVAFLFKKNKIDGVPRQGPHRGPGHGRGDGRRRRQADAQDQEHRDRHGLRRGGCPASPSTRRRSSPPPARWRSPKCRSTWSWSARGIIGLELGSVWRRLGARGDRGRVSRPHPPGVDGEVASSFQRILQSRASTSSSAPRSSGVETTGRLQVSLEPARRRARDARRRRRAGRDRPRALHGRAGLASWA